MFQEEKHQEKPSKRQEIIIIIIPLDENSDSHDGDYEDDCLLGKLRRVVW
jgi:hypothetical protein